LNYEGIWEILLYGEIRNDPLTDIYGKLKKHAMKYLKNALLIALIITCSCDGQFNDETPVTFNTGVSNGTTNLTKTSSQSRVTSYTFNGTEGDPIARSTAKAWTANFRELNPSGTEAHFFGADIIKQVLAEDGCVGIRMYYALDDKQQPQILLVGVNAQGQNLMPQEQALNGNDPNVIVDASWPCPTYCPNGSF
jgi:hypothetical protein